MENEKRLIDANALMDRLKFKRKISELGLFRGLDSAIAQVEKAPTVDAVEVVHGRWQKRTFVGNGGIIPIGYRCSRCMTTWDAETYYCPNCGAKMDGDGNGTTQD